MSDAAARNTEPKAADRGAVVELVRLVADGGVRHEGERHRGAGSRPWRRAERPGSMFWARAFENEGTVGRDSGTDPVGIGLRGTVFVQEAEWLLLRPDRRSGGGVSDEHPSFEDLSTTKKGLWPILLAACRHFRMPVPPQLWFVGD